MRKLRNFKTIQLEEGYEVKDLSFDSSGSYLAVAGTDVRVFLCKQWNELLVSHDHTATATGVRFGDNARYNFSFKISEPECTNVYLIPKLKTCFYDLQ